MVKTSDSMMDVLKRMRDRAEDPEFQKRVAALDLETENQRVIRADTERALWLATSGVPRAARELLEHPDPTDAIEAASRFLANPSCLFLTLAGPRGRGKTSAASWACYQKRGRFVDAHELVRAGTFERHLWDDLARTPMLVIDELGSEYANDSFRADLFGVLNKRQGDLRQTIIVTNLDAAGFRARYLSGPMDRLEDRLRAYGEWVALPGESLRTHWTETMP
jgi:DNA replication protein DnaC